MQYHDLKILPEYFEKVMSGEKTFELREDDRGFAVGDILVLNEYCSGEFTGKCTIREVTYKFTGPGYGLESGFCILSMKEIK